MPQKFAYIIFFLYFCAANAKRKKNDMSTHSYSVEELNARAALSEIQMAQGKTYTHAEVMTGLRERARKIA